MLKLLPLLFILLACNKQTEQKQTFEVLSLSGQTMGTTYSIKYVENPDSKLDRALMQKEISELLVKINQEMSTYIPDSEIMRFNGLKTTQSWFQASPGFHWVTKVALTLAKETGGIYDPTIAPLVDLWGFGVNKHKNIPTDKQISEVLKTVGFTKVATDEEKPLIRKLDINVKLDLSSIAKGWGVDQVGRLLENKGIKHYMVEIGGEVRTFGAKPDGSFWVLGVVTPEVGDVTGVKKLVALSNQALATSGDYRNYFEKDGKRYAHILDPRSGKPAMSDIASVSVIDPDGDCTMADALATALLAMGTEAAKEFAVKRNLPVLIYSHSGEEFVEWMTPEFQKYIKTTP